VDDEPTKRPSHERIACATILPEVEPPADPVNSRRAAERRIGRIDGNQFVPGTAPGHHRDCANRRRFAQSKKVGRQGLEP
jgi:hypothetical protein